MITMNCQEQMKIDNNDFGIVLKIYLIENLQ